MTAGDIPKRVFGKTGEKLTIIGQAGGRFPMCSYEDAKAISLRAYKLGINYFDCARIYWNGKSEEVYGDILPPFRKKIFLTTKSLQRNARAPKGTLRSLYALKTDYLDLWQIHQVCLPQIPFAAEDRWHIRMQAPMHGLRFVPTMKEHARNPR